MPPPVAYGLLVSILLVFLAGSSAPTPLYSAYQAEWGFSPIAITVIFGVYAIAVLIALLTVGSLSDHIGRRPVLLAALAVQAVTMVVFATANGLPELLLARVLQGLSTGAAVGALGAGLLDLNRVKGTVANGVGALAGTAAGALGSGLLVQFLPAPTSFVYLVLFGIFVMQFFAVLAMPEMGRTRPGALASLRPQFAVPPVVRRQLLLVLPMVAAVWALPGFYGSLGPALVRTLAGSTSAVVGGLALFTLAGSGSLTVLVLRSVPARTVLLLGTGALLAGVGLTLPAIAYGSATLFFLGTVLAGVGFGSGFQGALRTVMPLAAASERAGLLSTVYVVSYLAMGVPAVIAGYLVVHGGGLSSTAREYGAAVLVLAATALVGQLVPRRSKAHPVGSPCAA